MKNRLFAIKRSDGGESTTRVSKWVEDVEAAMQRVIDLHNSSLNVEDQTLPSGLVIKGLGKFLSYRPIREDQLPKDRKDRMAWTDDYDTDTVDIRE